GYGFNTIAKAAAEVKRRFGGPAEQAYIGWWQEYNLQAEDIRKEKYGTQFTPTEEARFERLTVQPSDSFPSAMTKLQGQRDLIRRNARTQRSVLEDMGFTTPPLRAPPAIDVDGGPAETPADNIF
ncbi:unnamed protein product, partial [marine sediment metagenome]